MTTAKGTPTSTPVIESWCWIAGCGDAELVGAMAEFCDDFGASELVRLEEEERDMSVAVVDNTDVVTDCLGVLIVEIGYGSSEVVRLVVQQFEPPNPCPAAPAQHQLLPLGSQRLTSVKPSN